MSQPTTSLLDVEAAAANPVIIVPAQMIVPSEIIEAQPTPAPAALPGSPAPPTGSVLSDQEASILAFERQWWRYAGAKEQAIRDTFEMSPTRYYQTLNAMLDSADAMAHDPALVKRLRRLRASRLRSRARG